MPYITQSEICPSDIPLEFLTEALDDDRDGEIDSGAWNTLVSSIEDEIDGMLSPVADVPFADSAIPPLVRHCARIFALEKLWAKRGFTTEENNPWAAPANKLRKRLEKIGDGDLPLEFGSASTSASSALNAPSEHDATRDKLNGL